VRVDEHTTTVDDVPVFYRTAGGPWTGARPLYLHEAITSSDDWVPFLERTGGIAPDLIGFGRSGKGGHLEYSPEGMKNFLARLLSELGVDRFTLIGHGWGAAIGLLLLLDDPSRAERVVLIDAVPLLEGFRWHRPARLWRRPVIGELAMGATSRRQLTRQLRRGVARPAAWTTPRLGATWEQFDQGTQRALLRLHRAADERRLAELGLSLGTLRMPGLVVWGERDPWFGPQFADAYGVALPGATVRRIPDAGHWPWLDQPQVIELVGEFVERG
jgi:pimeloyl-ACP methyl ester carboxylesterase